MIQCELYDIRFILNGEDIYGISSLFHKNDENIPYFEINIISDNQNYPIIKSSYFPQNIEILINNCQNNTNHDEIFGIYPFTFELSTLINNMNNNNENNIDENNSFINNLIDCKQIDFNLFIKKKFNDNDDKDIYIGTSSIEIEDLEFELIDNDANEINYISEQWLTIEINHENNNNKNNNNNIFNNLKLCLFQLKFKKIENNKNKINNNNNINININENFIDSFGFPVPHECINIWRLSEELCEKLSIYQWDEWKKYESLWMNISSLKNNNNNNNNKNDMNNYYILRNLIWLGLPDPLRDDLCMELSNANEKKKLYSIDYYFKLKLEINDNNNNNSDNILNLIFHNSLAKTLILTDEQQNSVNIILKIILKINNNNIDMCEELCCIISLLTLVLKEETTFWLINIIINDILNGYFKEKIILNNNNNNNINISKNHLIECDKKALYDLIENHLPDLLKHCILYNIKLEDIGINWIKSLYSSCMPRYTSLRIIELTFFENSDILFIIYIAFLYLIKKDILKIFDYMSLYQFIYGSANELYDIEKLFRLTFNLYQNLSIEINQRRSYYLHNIIQNEYNNNNINNNNEYLESITIPILPNPNDTELKQIINHNHNNNNNNNNNFLNLKKNDLFDVDMNDDNILKEDNFFDTNIYNHESGNINDNESIIDEEEFVLANDGSNIPGFIFDVVYSAGTYVMPIVSKAYSYVKNIWSWINKSNNNNNNNKIKEEKENNNDDQIINDIA